MTAEEQPETLGPFTDWWYCSGCGTANRPLDDEEALVLGNWMADMLFHAQPHMGGDPRLTLNQLAWVLEVWQKQPNPIEPCDHWPSYKPAWPIPRLVVVRSKP